MVTRLRTGRAWGREAAERLRLRRERGEAQRRTHAAEALAAQAQAELKQLREALDELPCGLEIYDSEDRLRLVNRRMVELYPWIRYDEHVGSTFETILRTAIQEGRIPPAVGREETWLAQRLATRGTREGPVLQSLKSGHWINTYERRTPSSLVVGVRLEVSDLVQKSRELEDSQARLQAVIGSAAAAIVSTDSQGVILELNAAAAQLFGREAQSLAGLPLSTLIPACGPPGLRPLREAEVAGRGQDGAPLPLLLSVSEIHTAMGQQFVAVIADLTQRRLAEEARLKAQRLEAENRQIQEASRMKSQFLANMSHELRTPLNAIIGFAELMHSGMIEPSSPKYRNYLGHIATSGRHLLELINGVLDLSKVEAGRLEFAPQPVQLAPLVQEVGDVLHDAIERKRIAFVRQVDPQLGELYLDPGRLRQVLYNYLSNAIKFTPDGGRVTVRAVAQGEAHFRLEVQDTGVGVAPKDLPRLFREFQQLDSGYGKQHPGTGLGLALTMRLVEAQGGSVGVCSEPGRGSTFHAVLNRVHGTDAPVRSHAAPETP